MSLIQEALKRQQEEAGGQTDAGGSAPPDLGLRPKKPASAASATRGTQQEPMLGAPPPLPLSAQPSSDLPKAPEVEPQLPARRKPSPLVIVGITAAILILGAVGLFAAWFLLRQRAASSPVPDRSVAATNAIATPDQTPVTAQAATPQSPSLPASLPSQPSSQASQSTAPAPGRASAAEELPKQPRPWPKLTLTAFVGKGTRGEAVINGKLHSVGETVDGARLVSIGDGLVVLEYQGETQSLRVGGSQP